MKLKETVLSYLYVKVYPEKQGIILRPLFRAQQAMEQKYLNTIRKILGDPYFHYGERAIKSE